MPPGHPRAPLPGGEAAQGRQVPGESVRPGRRRSRGPLRLRRGLFGRRIVPSTPSPEGAEAAAAAALVAAQRPGGEPVSTSHGPDGALPAFAIDLRPPAVEVLDRVIAEDPEPADPRMAPPMRKGASQHAPLSFRSNCWGPPAPRGRWPS
ncbi:DUF4259 domain-containing protein [Kitasatospora cineracea]|uniref:DUF4259 domain-containing protein n=1 Tax=Kitasatospora cineracea TaxID=88074 RepID=UPI003F4D12D3